MNMSSGIGQVGLWRRAALLGIGGACALGIGAALAAAPAGAGRGPAGSAPATRAAAASPSDKAAAAAEFDKASALYQQKKYAEAQVENEKALQLDPTNTDALLLRGVLKTYLAGGGVTPATTQGGVMAVGGKIPLLTAQQISLVRLMELGAADNRVVGRIDPKVLDDFWQNVVLKDESADKSPAARSQFINPANISGQVRRIRDSRDMKYMEQITLNTDPATFVAYRSNVQTYVLQNCATADCHGGEKAPGGNFRLLNPATTVEQQYTDFYILSMYANADGKMVDRANPDKSLLIQYGLPWANAASRHPKVEARRLSGPTDGRIRTMLDWINSLGIARPNYGISYDVPGAAAAAPKPAPASAPASAPAATGRGR